MKLLKWPNGAITIVTSHCKRLASARMALFTGFWILLNCFIKTKKQSTRSRKRRANCGFEATPRAVVWGGHAPGDGSRDCLAEAAGAVRPSEHCASVGRLGRLVHSFWHSHFSHSDSLWALAHPTRSQFCFALILLNTKNTEQKREPIEWSCGQRTPRETRLMLVFEHVDYDLEQYIRNNSPGT